MRYPVAEREPLVDELHAHRVADPYRWLEDGGGARTRDWLRGQDELWRAYAAGLPDRAVFHARVAELTDVGLVTTPVWRGERQFWLRRTAGQDHPVLCTAVADGPERTLVDPMTLDPTGLTTLDSWQPDGTGGRLAYQLSQRGEERSALYVLDVGTGRVLDGPIDRCRYSPVAWLPGGHAFFYVRSMTGDVVPDTATHRRRVLLHRVGEPASADAEVFGDGHDDTSRYGLGISEDGRWLLISVSVGTSPGNSLWLADLSRTGPERPEPWLLHDDPNAPTIAYSGRDGRLYLLTHVDAPRGRLCVADPETAHHGPAGWRELVSEEADAVLTNFVVLDGPALARPVLLVGWLRQAVGEIGVHDIDSGRRISNVPVPGPGSLGSLSARSGGHEVWFSYTDSVTPPTVYRFDARTDGTTPWAAPPGQVVTRGITTRRLTALSADGTPVRVEVIAGPAAGAEPRPTVLYGYGGFGLSLTPTYSAYILAWVRAGGVFALAHLRGGGEHGEQWHRDGQRDRKQNVVDDFVAAARLLVVGGWTRPAQLAACGESNGGLIVGAALTQRPDLFGAAVCSAPLLDMVRYERSGLGAQWRAEYGSASDPEQLAWLLGYSPYHHVRPGVAYPAVLFTVSAGDTRVDPMHARKMCAALQWATSGARPILLREESGVGHGARAVSRSVALAGDMLAFLAAETGLGRP